MATVYNFSATQGSQLSVRLNVKDASGDPINLSGYAVRGVVKYRYSSTSSLVNLDPEDANKDFDENFIYKTYVEPLGKIGKEKSPEEKAKSRAESEKIYSDIKQTLKSQPEFDTVEQAKTKITNFIQK